MVVLPKAQARGIGRLMMEAVTDKADAEKMKCYLESSRDVPNMQIYERFGFKFAKELECDDDGTAIKLFTSEYSRSRFLLPFRTKAKPFPQEACKLLKTSYIILKTAIANSECCSGKGTEDELMIPCLSDPILYQYLILLREQVNYINPALIF